MSNKEEREQKEMKNLFGDPKTARLAWRSVGAAILQSPCSQRIDVYDKDGTASLDTQVEQYGYASLKHDLDSLSKGGANREPTELEMIFRCQAIHARHNPASATFIRDTVGAKPVDESKAEVTNINPYDELTDDELEALAAYRSSKSASKSATPEQDIVDASAHTQD